VKIKDHIVFTRPTDNRQRLYFLPLAFLTFLYAHIVGIPIRTRLMALYKFALIE